MAKKDSKAKAAEKKARAAAKQNKKADKKEKKSKSKGNADDSDVDDVDLEAVLEEYAKQASSLVLELLNNNPYISSMKFSQRFVTRSS